MRFGLGARARGKPAVGPQGENISCVRTLGYWRATSARSVGGRGLTRVPSASSSFFCVVVISTCAPAPPTPHRRAPAPTITPPPRPCPRRRTERNLPLPVGARALLARSLARGGCAACMCTSAAATSARRESRRVLKSLSIDCRQEHRTHATPRDPRVGGRRTWAWSARGCLQEGVGLGMGGASVWPREWRNERRAATTDQRGLSGKKGGKRGGRSVSVLPAGWP